MFCNHRASLDQASLLLANCLASIWLRCWWNVRRAGPIVVALVDFPPGLRECFLMCWVCYLMVSMGGVECTILPFPRGLESHQQIERKFSFFPFFWPKENEVNPTEKTIVFLYTIFIFKMNRFGMMLKIKKKN